MDMPSSTEVQDPTPPPPGIQLALPHHRPVGALKAILIFIVYMLGQVMAGAFAVLVYVVVTGKDPDAVAAAAADDPVLLLVTATAGFVFAGPAVVALARAFERGSTWKEALAPFGMVKAPGRMVAGAAALGVVIALTLGYGLEQMFPSPEHAEGALVQAASAPGWQRALFVVLAVVLAPIFEEFLFRGVMYTGMLRSWGKWPAAVVVTLSFGLLHIFDLAGYWPALAMITLVGAALMAVRMRTKSLLPCIAMHSTYNLFQVIVLYFLS